MSDPIVVALVAVVSWEGLRWSLRVIAEAIANRKRVKIVPCPRCGEFVEFNPPIKLPTRAELYNFAGQVLAAGAAAEGGMPPGVPPFQPITAEDERRVLEQLDDQLLELEDEQPQQLDQVPPLPGRVRG